MVKLIDVRNTHNSPPRVIVLFETSQALLCGIARYCRLNNPWKLYHSLPYYREQMSWRKQLQRMRNFQPDGIIVHMHTEEKARELRNYVALGKPAIISLHSGKAMKGVIPIVNSDFEIGRIAADHFFERSFRNFAYCGLDKSILWSLNRGNGFVARLAQKELSAVIYQYPKARNERLWEHEQNRVAKWVAELPKPIGILASNDDRGREVLEACYIAAVKVPEEVAVLGVGNHQLTCELFDPPLSSIVTSREKAGYDAASLLNALMSGQTITQDRIVIEPTRVETRRSTDIIAVFDEYVADALRFIHNNFKKQIQVNDVVWAVAISRRKLERRFKKILNRSILDEIRRVQIRHICLLLQESNMTISQIAAHMNQPDIDRFSRFFRKKTGMGPRAYRQKVRGD